ncbi:hypothetical protein AOLI_G00243180 [Acnodon oligacanthus]
MPLLSQPSFSLFTDRCACAGPLFPPLLWQYPLACGPMSFRVRRLFWWPPRAGVLRVALLPWLFFCLLLLLVHSTVELRDVIGNGCRSGLQFWSQLLGLWNGFSFFYSESSGSLALFTDTTPSGFVGYVQGQWCMEKWPAEFSESALGSASLALHKMYPIFSAGFLW